MKFEDFLELVILTKIDQPAWRMGQTLMNLLYDHNRELYDRITATGFDPFFCETVVGPFLYYIKRHWNVSESQMD